jgi:hypothetical protein
MFTAKDDHGSLKGAYDDPRTNLWASIFPIDLVSVCIAYFRPPVDIGRRLMDLEVVCEYALSRCL